MTIKSGFHFNRGFFIYLLFISVIFSFLGEGILNPYRIVAIISIFFFPLSIKKSYLNEFKFELYFFILLLLIGLSFILFGQSSISSLYEIISIIFYLLIFILITLFIYEKNLKIEFISDLWAFAFFVTVPIAFCEIIYDIHLPMSNMNESPELVYNFVEVRRSFASVTFGNLNGYNTFMVFSIPFILPYVLHSNRKRRYLYIFLTIILISLILINASRSSFLCLFIAVCVLIIRNKRKISFFSLFFLIGVIIFVIHNFSSVIFLRLFESGVSDPQRVILIEKSIYHITNNLLGSGPASFKEIMGGVYGLDLTASHNLFLEIGLQYGVMMLLYFLLFPLMYIIRLRKVTDLESKNALLIGCCIFPLCFIIDSGYLNSPLFVLFLASMSSISFNR